MIYNACDNCIHADTNSEACKSCESGDMAEPTISIAGNIMHNHTLEHRDPRITFDRKYDSHYRDIEKSGIEPIVVMEELIARLVDVGVPPKKAAMIMLAQKHITRAGLKNGDSWEKDIQKAMNYLNRSITGEWIKDDTK